MADGFEILIARMNSLTHDQFKVAQRRALKETGIVIKEAIVDRAPELDKVAQSSTALPPGALKGDIRIAVHTATDAADTNRVRVGPGKQTAHVAEWVENGHNISGGKKRPGMKGRVKAHPFVRPAADAVESLARQVYQNVMNEEIEKVMDGESD